jgi:hypothetical protein
MKTKFRHNVKSVQGHDRSEDEVYCSYNNGDLMITRKMPHRDVYETNKKFGRISSNIHKLYKTLSEEYIRDLSNYSLALQSVAYNPNKIPMRSFGVFTRMMWALKKRFPEIDLEAITREDIIKNEYLIRSIVEAMMNGLLVNIPEAEMLTAEI